MPLYSSSGTPLILMISAYRWACKQLNHDIIKNLITDKIYQLSRNRYPYDVSTTIAIRITGTLDQDFDPLNGQKLY